MASAAINSRDERLDSDVFSFGAHIEGVRLRSQSSNNPAHWTGILCKTGD
jgi:hypothetical protein